MSLPLAALSIGRDPGNDVVIADALVSRRHAEIIFSGQGYVLRDCNSSNGSLVNGDRVSERSLHDGDVVWLGASRLLFRGDVHPTEGNLAKVVQHPSSSRLRCAVCEHGFHPGDAFCRHCGTPIEGRQAPLQCETCGVRLVGPAKFCNECGGPLSLAPPRVRPHEPTGAALSMSWKPGAQDSDAPAEQRVIAGAIDAVVSGVLAGLFIVPAIFLALSSSSGAALGGVLSVLGLVAVMSYFVAFWALRGATPGKELLGLALVTKSGEPMSWRSACVRFAGYVLSALPLGLGFFMLIVDGETLHDRLAQTRVVARR